MYKFFVILALIFVMRVLAAFSMSVAPTASLALMLALGLGHLALFVLILFASNME